MSEAKMRIRELVAWDLDQNKYCSSAYAPPRAIDFLGDALVTEYHRSPIIKARRVKVEETYTL